MKSLYVGAAVLAAAWSCGASAATLGGYDIGTPYVRGDIGGAFPAFDRFKSDNPDAANSLLPPGGRIVGDADATEAFDIGAGTRLTPYLRWDATLSYIPSMRFSGGDNIGAGSVETANIDSLVGMINGYVDLAGLAPGMFGPFQPYVDGGVGAASNHIGNMGSTLAGGQIFGNTDTSFAWGLGAGVGIGLTHNTVLDISYRYLDLGEVRTSISDSTGGSISPLKTDIRANTVMLGVRVAL